MSGFKRWNPPYPLTDFSGKRVIFSSGAKGIGNKKQEETCASLKVGKERNHFLQYNIADTQRTTTYQFCLVLALKQTWKLTYINESSCSPLEKEDWHAGRKFEHHWCCRNCCRGNSTTPLNWVRLNIMQTELYPCLRSISCYRPKGSC